MILQLNLYYSATTRTRHLEKHYLSTTVLGNKRFSIVFANGPITFTNLICSPEVSSNGFLSFQVLICKDNSVE